MPKPQDWKTPIKELGLPYYFRTTSLDGRVDVTINENTSGQIERGARPYRADVVPNKPLGRFEALFYQGADSDMTLRELERKIKKERYIFVPGAC